MRSGPKIPIKKVIGPNERIKNVIRDSISNFGARLYNSIPCYIRTFRGTLPQFKTMLDEYLAVIPDQPAVGDMIPGSRNIQGKPSNSVIDWCRGMKGVIESLPHYEDQYVVGILASSLEYPERIRVVSVFEPLVCSLLVSKFSHFSLFHPSIFIQYSTEECSTVQLFIYKIIAVKVDIDMS